MARWNSIEKSTFERMEQILSDLEYCFDVLLDDDGARKFPCALRAASLRAERLAKKFANAALAQDEGLRLSAG